ncbi:unnamed protein product, partial [Polarella glacialis]
MRVDNKIQIFDYVGSHFGSIAFEELMLAGWRPRPRGAFQDRPSSPGRQKVESKDTQASAKPQPSKQAYRPPGARGGGGLSELLRKELGSTSADTVTTATKVAFGGGLSQAMPRLPPGAAPQDHLQASDASGSSRNARKKKAKEAAQAAADAEVQEKLVAALSPAAARRAAEKPKFEPPSRSDETAAVAPTPEGGGDVSEPEKKARALRKKLRDIEKLKDKAKEGPLDPLQKEKIKGEAELIRQIRELGFEP